MNVCVSQRTKPYIDPVRYLDEQAPNELGEILIKVTDGRPDVRLTGTLVANASTQRPNSTTWSEISVYRTKRNRYVIAEKGLSSNADHNAFCSVNVARKLDHIAEHLGYTKLAIQIYRQLDITEVAIP
ncbi:hypothetical protein [Tranquillimonas alkanivorans]|uniref:Uncharacterized protein n=1 Tax=Tranquillimonas alkanivorans TaxID=441119 RepID=A0A1I5UWS5_9RHOB|nr:hypothetical protein [Tranquillimonas alkanivorans]SFP99794.1 hypothetical protein SAMN04488047_1253 [Tranquillimonas alkanivorans]